MSFRIIPRIMPESYPNHTSNFPILNLGTFARSEPVFCELFFLQPFSAGYTTPPAASEKNPTTAPCSVQQHPSLAPASHRSKLYTPLWQQATPCTSTLQRHSNGTTMPAPKRTHHSDSSTHSVNSMPAPKRSTYGIIANSWNIFGVSVGK